MMKKSFDCTKCRRTHHYPMYVYAHWDESLIHTCECGAKHELQSGHVFFVSKKKANVKIEATEPLLAKVASNAGLDNS